MHNPDALQARQAVLRVLETGPPGGERTAVCVVRCLEGTARLGMRFVAENPGGHSDAPQLTLARIEWYARDVEELDTAHAARATLTGAIPPTLAAGTLLRSTGPDEPVPGGERP